MKTAAVGGPTAGSGIRNWLNDADAFLQRGSSTSRARRPGMLLERMADPQLKLPRPHGSHLCRSERAPASTHSSAVDCASVGPSHIGHVARTAIGISRSSMLVFGGVPIVDADTRARDHVLPQVAD
jgi:hypothetical protein